MKLACPTCPSGGAQAEGTAYRISSMLSAWRLAAVAAALLAPAQALVTATRRAEETESDVNTSPKKALFGEVHVVPLRSVDGKSVDVQMELAITPEEMHTGLMFRTEMDPDHGMLFLYRRPAKHVLYMRDTFIPLDVGWFTADGTLGEIMGLHEVQSETWHWTEGEDYVFGLEMNLGWFDRRGLRPHRCKLDMHTLTLALRARGENPQMFSSLLQ